MPTARSRKTAPPDGLTREERTRGEILEAARLLVERHGFAKVTMDDIAGALGKRKSFLYYYYPDKESILSSAIEKEAMEMQQEVEKAIARERTGLARTRAYIFASLQEIHKRFPLILKLRGGEVQARNRDTLGLLVEKSSELMKIDFPRLAQLLRDGVADGSVRKFGEKEIESLARFISLALHGIEYEFILGEADEHLLENTLTVALGCLEQGISG